MIKRVHELRRAVKAEHRVLTDLMAAPEPDREAIEEQLGRIAAVRQELDRHVVEHFLDVREFLDPDQRGAFNKTIRRAFSHGGPGGRGLGGHHGSGKGRGRGREGRLWKNTERFEVNRQKETEE
jgi:Spy/CpxP family protein refolding chaperone